MIKKLRKKDEELRKANKEKEETRRREAEGRRREAELTEKLRQATEWAETQSKEMEKLRQETKRDQETKANITMIPTTLYPPAQGPISHPNVVQARMRLGVIGHSPSLQDMGIGENLAGQITENFELNDESDVFDEDETNNGDIDDESDEEVPLRVSRFTQALVQPNIEHMDKLLDKAIKILEHWADLEFTTVLKHADATLVRFLLKKSKGIVLMKLIRAVFIIGGSRGSGVILSKKNGEWGGPHAVNAIGGQVGFGAGMSETDTLTILTSDKAMDSFAGGAVKIGGNVQFAAGPSGYDYTYSKLKNPEGWAPAYSYNYCKGAFLSVSLEGLYFSQVNKTNIGYYDNISVTPKMILSHEIETPANAKYDQLRELLDKMTTGAPDSIEDLRKLIYVSGERVFVTNDSDETILGTIGEKMENQRYQVIPDDSNNCPDNSKLNLFFSPSSIQRAITRQYSVGTRVTVNLKNGDIRQGEVRGEIKDNSYSVKLDCKESDQFFPAELVQWIDPAVLSEEKSMYAKGTAAKAVGDMLSNISFRLPSAPKSSSSQPEKKQFLDRVNPFTSSRGLPQKTSDDSWVCRSCTFSNNKLMPICEICSTSK